MSSIKIKYKDRIEYQNEKGNLHREDGPAIEFSDGDKWWIVNGKCHREDGPAVEYRNGTKSWYLYGIKYYSEEKWEQEVAKIKLERILTL
jgi:hypothetical protein